MWNTLKFEAQGADGKTYWLREQTFEEREGRDACYGCAFHPATCEREMASGACVSNEPWLVWEAK